MIPTPAGLVLRDGRAPHLQSQMNHLFRPRHLIVAGRTRRFHYRIFAIGHFDCVFGVRSCAGCRLQRSAARRTGTEVPRLTPPKQSPAESGPIQYRAMRPSGFLISTSLRANQPACAWAIIAYCDAVDMALRVTTCQKQRSRVLDGHLLQKPLWLVTCCFRYYFCTTLYWPALHWCHKTAQRMKSSFSNIFVNKRADAPGHLDFHRHSAEATELNSRTTDRTLITSNHIPRLTTMWLHTERVGRRLHYHFVFLFWGAVLPRVAFCLDLRERHTFYVTRTQQCHREASMQNTTDAHVDICSLDPWGTLGKPLATRQTLQGCTVTHSML